ncbi:amino acid ABC transporter permease [Streptomyces misionensis]|uniref:amino acid ABC transporter permease n=1 Tax=Streptomyces misionensis TaxID=67331 RepID=UPI003432EB5D
MAWDEWEQLKAGAAQRMQIDHLADSGDGGSSSPHGGSAPDLKASKGPWAKASGVAKDLQTVTNAGLTELKTAHEGVKGGTEGFSSTVALNEILSTWEKRLTSVRDECDRLHGALAMTGREFGELDPAVADKVNGVHVGGNKPDWAR